MFCNNCGKELKEHTNFCTKCGQQISNEIEKVNNSQIKRSKFRTLKSIFIYIVNNTLIIVAIIGIVYGLCFYLCSYLLAKELKQEFKSIQVSLNKEYNEEKQERLNEMREVYSDYIGDGRKFGEDREIFDLKEYRKDIAAEWNGRFYFKPVIILGTILLILGVFISVKINKIPLMAFTIELILVCIGMYILSSVLVEIFRYERKICTIVTIITFLGLIIRDLLIIITVQYKRKKNSRKEIKKLS